MGPLEMISAIGLPVAMAVGAILAWRMTKKESAASEEKPAWRDDSLDDWRKEREAEADAARLARLNEPEVLTGSAEERAETKRHQRIGG